jgi:hypothetical protein
MEYLVYFWNYRISAGFTAMTGLLLLWQYWGPKGTFSHVVRWAAILLLSVFVVYMNTEKVLRQHPPIRITNVWHIRLMAFHQNMGLVYFALLAAMPLLGGSLMAAVRYRWRGEATLRFVHRWAGYGTGIFWLISNIASEIGSRIPRS